MQQRDKDFAEAPLFRLLMKYSTPAIIGMVVSGLYNVVDRIFIGRIPEVGNLAIAGVGIAAPVMTIQLAFAMLIGIGTTSQFAISLGRGQPERAEKLLGNAFVLTVVSSLAITVLGLIFLQPMLQIFGASEAVMPYAYNYSAIILIGNIFFSLGFALNHSIRSDGSPITSGATQVIGCVVNIILDPIFIFVLDMGVAGAAWATIISQTVSMLWVLYYFTLGHSKAKLRVSNFALDAKLVGSICSIGISPFAMQLAAALVIMLANNQLYRYGGDLAISGFTAVASVITMFTMPIFGMSQGMQPIVGYNYGAKNFKRAQRTFWLATAAATFILMFGFVGSQFFPEALIRMFSNDPELLELASDAMRMHMRSIPLVGLAVMGPIYFQNTGRPRVSLLLSLMRQLILFLPGLYIMPYFFGLYGIFNIQPICDVITTVVILALIFKDFSSTADLNDDKA